MAIRFKTSQYCWWTPKAPNDPDLTQVCVDEVVPIRDWATNPVQIIAPSWTPGAPNPLPVNLTFVFPELEFIYTGYAGIRYKLQKTISGTDFLEITAADLTGNIFNNLNQEGSLLSIAFKMDNLAPGQHDAVITVDAYGVDDSGNETHLESSMLQNVFVPVQITVLGTSDPQNPTEPTAFNTDKNAYFTIYNKADGTLSGDAQIIAYTLAAITATPSDDFITLEQAASGNQQNFIFKVNPVMSAKETGNYSGTVTLTTGNISKVVSVNLQVINDRSQFYVLPAAFSANMQQSPAETKTFSATLTNPNNLVITVDLKPSFIEAVSISGNLVSIKTKSSSNLAIGNYSGDIILK